MDDFFCEAVGSLVVVKIARAVTEHVLEECHRCVLRALRESGARAVLYDLTEMPPTPLQVLLHQRRLDEDMAPLQVRRAIVVPDTLVAHVARLAFGSGDFRLFYDDMEGARRYLLDIGAMATADWHVGVTEERRLRERRASRRPESGRRERDRVIV